MTDKSRVHPFFEEVLDSCTEEEFLDGVRSRYHYPPGERETLREIARAMQSRMRREAVWGHSLDGTAREESGTQSALWEELRMSGTMPWEEAPGQGDADGRPASGQKTLRVQVAMTLGAGVDLLQDQYLREGRLTEGYMVEVLASEILLGGYEAYNRYVAEHTPYHVARYYFLNDEAALGELPKLLGTLALPITCNDAYCMTPKKSVAFYAGLTREETAVCPGICLDCGSANCPNRIEKAVQRGWHFADMIDRPLPYGYARIFGTNCSGKLKKPHADDTIECR